MIDLISNVQFYTALVIGLLVFFLVSCVRKDRE